MSRDDDRLAHHARRAVETAAEEMGVPPLALAQRLDNAEIARLVHLLNASQHHVTNAGLRHRIEILLGAVTEGRMPDQSPESELDWALKVAGRRRREARRDRPAASPPPPSERSPTMARTPIFKKDGSPSPYFWREDDDSEREHKTVYRQTADGVRRMRGVHFDAVANKLHKH